MAVGFSSLVSAFLVSTAFGLLYVYQIGGPLSFEALSFIGFFGTLLALPFAAVLGILVEWPKAYWRRRQAEGGLMPHFLLSVLNRLGLMLAFLAATGGLRSLSQYDSDGWIFYLVCSVTGGLVSAALWWWLVVCFWRSHLAGRLQENE